MTSSLQRAIDPCPHCGCPTEDRWLTAVVKIDGGQAVVETLECLECGRDMTEADDGD